MPPLLSLLRPFEEEAFRASRRRERAGGERETHENRTYDALQALLASVGGSAGAGARTTAGRPGPGGGAGREAGGHEAGDRGPGAATARARAAAASASASADASVRPRGGDNTKVIVRVDLAAVLRGHTIAGETCEVDGVRPISAEAVKRLLLDRNPFVAAVLHDGREVQTVAHLGRNLSAHQRTAIEAMGVRCSNLACNKTVGMQIDHREPWANDPRTVLANQDPLCPDCHRRKTHHGWRLEPGTGPRRFRPPDAPGRSDQGSPTRSDRPPGDRSGGDGRRARARSSGPPGQVEQPTLC